jgi:pyruvate,water dikinase
MSVVVQEMVQATHCAVMMTQDPIEGQNILGIESSYGPCEILVSGRVDGDLLLYDKQSGRVVSQEIGDKETIISYDIFTGENGNIREIPVQPNLRQVPALSPEQVKQLIEQGLKIEKIFGKPQDIEAAFVGDQLYILQTRNITTL